jgi:hypothetical protein
MANTRQPGADRSVSIGGNANGNIVQTGDGNTANLQYQHGELPDPQSVDIGAELAALRELLAKLDSPDQNKINNAIEEAEDELKKDKVDKDEIGKALERAISYAKKATAFAGEAQKLIPHLKATAAWLGSQWHWLLTLI